MKIPTFKVKILRTHSLPKHCQVSEFRMKITEPVLKNAIQKLNPRFADFKAIDFFDTCIRRKGILSQTECSDEIDCLLISYDGSRKRFPVNAFITKLGYVIASPIHLINFHLVASGFEQQVSDGDWKCWRNYISYFMDNSSDDELIAGENYFLGVRNFNCKRTVVEKLSITNGTCVKYIGQPIKIHWNTGGYHTEYASAVLDTGMIGNITEVERYPYGGIYFHDLERYSMSIGMKPIVSFYELQDLFETIK